MKMTRAMRRANAAYVAKFPAEMERVPDAEWKDSPVLPEGVIEVWRSRYFLVQVYAENDGVERATVNRTSHNGGSWDGEISWDELQKIKHDIGRGDKCAVELYPPDANVVNVANMRHLWILPIPPLFMWRDHSKEQI